jgi:hypothetical protein
MAALDVVGRGEVPTAPFLNLKFMEAVDQMVRPGAFMAKHCTASKSP